MTPTLRISLMIVGTAAEVPYRPLIIVMISALLAGNNLPICIFVTEKYVHIKSTVTYLQVNQPKNPMPPVARRYIPNFMK